MDAMAFFQVTDLVTVFCGLLFFVFAHITLREQLRVTEMMNTEVETDEDDDGTIRISSGDLEAFSQKGSSMKTAQGMKSTMWDQLAWEERMAHSRRQNVLNWVTAVFGMLTLLGGLFWSYAAIVLGEEGFLGTAGLVIFAVIFVIMAADLGFKFRRHYVQSGAAEQDRAMQREGRSLLAAWLMGSFALYAAVYLLTGHILLALGAVVLLMGFRQLWIRFSAGGDDDGEGD